MCIEDAFSVPFILSWYVTIHFQDRRSAASLRLRNRAKITDLIMCKAKSHSIRFSCRRSLFPFRKRSLPFLTVDDTTGNQAFSHDGCNIFPGLSYNKANNTFLNNLRKNNAEAQVEFTLKSLERARVNCYLCDS